MADYPCFIIKIRNEGAMEVAARLVLWLNKKRPLKNVVSDAWCGYFLNLMNI